MPHLRTSAATTTTGNQTRGQTAAGTETVIAQPRPADRQWRPRGRVGQRARRGPDGQPGPATGHPNRPAPPKWPTPASRRTPTPARSDTGSPGHPRPATPTSRTLPPRPPPPPAATTASPAAQRPPTANRRHRGVALLGSEPCQPLDRPPKRRQQPHIPTPPRRQGSLRPNHRSWSRRLPTVMTGPATTQSGPPWPAPNPAGTPHGRPTSTVCNPNSAGAQPTAAVAEATIHNRPAIKHRAEVAGSTPASVDTSDRRRRPSHALDVRTGRRAVPAAPDGR